MRPAEVAPTLQLNNPFEAVGVVVSTINGVVPVNIKLVSLHTVQTFPLVFPDALQK